MCKSVSESVLIVGKGKGNSKFLPRTDHEGPERYSSTLSLTSALEGRGKI